MTDLRNQLTRSIAAEGAHLRLVTPPRTLAVVLAEIAEAGPIVWQSGEAWGALTFEERGKALDRLNDLQAEARTMIEEATRCQWGDILRACL